MKVFSEAVALASPIATSELEASVCAIDDARAGRLPIELMIGVGPLSTDVPFRVLGYAGCVAEAIRSDVRLLIEPSIPKIRLFTSAPKTEGFHRGRALMSLVTLAGALRIAGVDSPIYLDFARRDPEIPPDLDIDLGPDLLEWVLSRDSRHRPGKPPSLRYALEHASPSMFADIADSDDTPVRITVGGATEARFWAVRMQVRSAAATRGLRIAPAVGVIIKALRVPWYQPTSYEPSLLAALRPAEAIKGLSTAANPARGGNGALRREARAAIRLVDEEGVADLIEAALSTERAMRFARVNGFNLGRRLLDAMENDDESASGDRL
ncbi:hypothetical protein [Aquibium sp. ELW1220]|uniref:hypothetical protein n=1 Tax=Aquibium sp. ELW1220 TaxID=2976766 RepID=UPI0025B1DA4C|nr:hypothetical protein [Aquibium sp. ELW1220]MDN2578748.1 hypothetical protein [Aquibium sp. ELW1220]